MYLINGCKISYYLFLDKDGVVLKADHVLVGGGLNRVGEGGVDQPLAPVGPLNPLLSADDPKNVPN